MTEPLIIPFLLFSLRKKDEVVAEYQFNKEDYDALREGMSKFEMKHIEGKLRGRWEQYMNSKNILSFTDRGVVVHDTNEYTRYNKMRSKLEAYDDMRQEEFWVMNPEEHQVWKDKLAEMGKEIREKINKL